MSQLGKNVGVPQQFYVNVVEAPASRLSSLVVPDAESKFSERLALYRANDAPVYIQQRAKIMFSKTNVPIGYKALLKVDAQVAYE